MRFPMRENDLRVLAELLINGLVDYPGYFPTPPVTPEDLKASFDSCKVARDAGRRALGSAGGASPGAPTRLCHSTDRLNRSVPRDRTGMRSGVIRPLPSWRSPCFHPHLRSTTAGLRGG